MSGSRIVRQKIWSRLAAVARPDSRFHLDFAHVIPDFEGSDAAVGRLCETVDPARIRLAFVTPDPSLVGVRRALLDAGVPILVATYDLHRGFVLLDPATIAPELRLYAAWLDGLEHFGRPLDLGGIAALGRFDLMVTGAAAVSIDGVRFGKGHEYFDLEWGLFSELGLADEETRLAALVHDVQVVDDRFNPEATDILVDLVATPTRVLQVPRQGRRPRGIDWNRVDPRHVEDIPPLAELARLRGMAAPPSASLQFAR